MPRAPEMVSTRIPPRPPILLYEENDLMRALLKEWLSQAGYVVQVADPDCVQPAADVALAIVSISMPKEAGSILLQSIRAAHPGTPCIALSAQFRSDLSTAGPTAQSLGVRQIMAKPLSRLALIEAVRGIIGPPS